MNKNLIILLIGSALIFFANIGGTSIYILDEAKNAGCAMEMHQRGDWVVPTFNDALRTDKPPLHYFFMKVSYFVFGINPFAARFFSAVMGLLTILSVYFFCRKLLNERVAFFSALILISSSQLAIQFHLAVPDPYLIFFLTTGLLSFVYAYVTSRNLFYYLFYAAISLATLAKGPVAIVFAGLIVIIFLIVQKKISVKALMDMKILQGVFIFIVVVLPWYVAVGIETQGEWLEQFFFKHNVGRFTSSMEGHSGFPFASFVIALVALMPFSFFFPQGIKLLWAIQKKNPFIQFCGVASLVVLTFFALSRTILPTYPEPALPFLAVLLGFFFNEITQNSYIKKKHLLVSSFIYMIVTSLLPFAVWFALKQESNLKQLTDISFYFLILPIGAAIACYFFIKGMNVKSFYAYVITSVAFHLLFFYFIFPPIDHQNPVSLSLITLKESKTKIGYRDFNPAYVFALQKPIRKFDNIQDVLKFAETHSEFLIVTQKKYQAELDTLSSVAVFEGKDLFENPTTIVLNYSNH